MSGKRHINHDDLISRTDKDILSRASNGMNSIGSRQLRVPKVSAVCHRADNYVAIT